MEAEPSSLKIYNNKHDEVSYFAIQRHATGRSERMPNSYSRIPRGFFHDQLPDLSPGEAEIRYVEDYLMVPTDRDVSQNSKKRCLEALSSFYGYMLKWLQLEGTTGNPVTVIAEGTPRVRPDCPGCVTGENACKLISAIPNPRDRTITIVPVKTGVRLLEVLSIEGDDVDLEKGFIRLGERKGGKQTVVPIDDETIYAIKRYQLVNAGLDSPYLFTSNRGGRLSREWTQWGVKIAVDRAGVTSKEERRFEKKFAPRAFHTVFITLMRKQGTKSHISKYIREDAKTEAVDIYTRIDCDEAREEYLDCTKEVGLGRR